MRLLGLLLTKNPLLRGNDVLLEAGEGEAGVREGEEDCGCGCCDTVGHASDISTSGIAIVVGTSTEVGVGGGIAAAGGTFVDTAAGGASGVGDTGTEGVLSEDVAAVGILSSIMLRSAMRLRLAASTSGSSTGSSYRHTGQVL